MQLGKSFRQFISLNLEKSEDRGIFDQELPVGRTLEAINFSKNANPTEQSTLLFIDEIQNSRHALGMLRYFAEEKPQLAVIAAGSLLEAYLEKTTVSFPVGRVEFMYQYPLSFAEYVGAAADASALQALMQVPSPDYARPRLHGLFHEYVLVGGMPEVVAHYTEHRDLAGLSRLYESLLVSYADDAAKYARNSSLFQHIRHAIETAPLEAGTRIKFQGFGRSAYRSREMGEALRTLERAMIIHLLYPTTDTELPLMPDLKRSPRLLYLDTGLLNFRAGLQAHFPRMEDLTSMHRGRIAEHVVGQEILARNVSVHRKPMFWVREKPDAAAEVDYVHIHQGRIVPVEVKAGPSGTLRSLHQMIDRTGQDLAVRLYAGRIDLQAARTASGKEFRLLNLPYYLAGRLDEHIAWAESQPRNDS